tara:strand:- start:264 stop:434 length:171 start_codon:yes stop_codon:yes gene_type:complete
MTDAYSFTVTVAKRSDCEYPTTEAEAARIVGWLLEQGAYLDILDIRRAEVRLVSNV